MIRTLGRTIAGVVMALALPVSVSATPIGGTLDMSGAFEPTSNGTATTNMEKSNGIDFLPLGGGTGVFSASNGTGNLVLFSGHSGTIKDLTFTPFSPVLSFYTITAGTETLSFDLTALTIEAQSANHLELEGTGTLHLTNFADTAATWDFEGESSNGASEKATFTWNALVDPPTSAVAEPPLLALLAAPLLGLAVLRRRRAV